MSTVMLTSVTEMFANDAEANAELQSVSVTIEDADLNRHKLTFRFSQPEMSNLRSHRIAEGDDLDALDDNRVDAVREAGREIARERWERAGLDVAPNPRTYRDEFGE